MNTKEIHEFINYHYWATYRLIDAVEPLTHEQFTRNMGNSFGSVRDTLVHLYSAEWVWLSRWQGVSPTTLLSSDLFPDIATTRKTFEHHEKKVRDFWKAVDANSLSQVLKYKTIAGQEFESPLWQMQVHVVNHGTYHRGQLTTMLRQLGAAPPKATDLIVYYRENPS